MEERGREREKKEGRKEERKERSKKGRKEGRMKGRKDGGRPETEKKIHHMFNFIAFNFFQSCCTK